jgi:hypothetical protein
VDKPLQGGHVGVFAVDNGSDNVPPLDLLAGEARGWRRQGGRLHAPVLEGERGARLLLLRQLRHFGRGGRLQTVQVIVVAPADREPAREAAARRVGRAGLGGGQRARRRGQRHRRRVAPAGPWVAPLFAQRQRFVERCFDVAIASTTNTK